MIGKRSAQEKQYEELLKKYDGLFSENEELKYELSEIKVNTDNIEKQDEEIHKLHESMRSIKHDMKNHLMVTLSYLNDGDTEAAKTYISGILNKLNAIHSYIETGNSLLNHILNDKLTAAREKNIDIKAEVENLAFAKMESMDFSALFSNMLDNAIEASLGEESPEIVVKVAIAREYETIVVKNRISSSVLEANPDLNTTKEDSENHGRGISQIRSITGRYNGMCDFYEEDGYFVSCAFIPV